MPEDAQISEVRPPEPAPVVKEKTDAEKAAAARQGLPSSVNVETATAAMPLAAADPNAKGPWIQYDGVATVRVMSAADWQSVGVESEQYCEWNYLNKKRLPREQFSDTELDYLLRMDGRFSLVEDQPESDDKE